MTETLPGLMWPFAVGAWVCTLHEELPSILTALEAVAIQRTLILRALHATDPQAATHLGHRLRVPLDGSDVNFGVGDRVENALRYDVIDYDPPADDG